MKHISSLVEIKKITDQTDQKVEHQANEYVASEKEAHVVNVLFRELKAIFPAFKQAWPTEEDFSRAKIHWIRAFKESEINTIEKLRHGIKRCRLSSNPFAPSVGQFIEWCNPTREELGLPTVEQAYEEACKNAHFSADKHWSHKAIYNAFKLTGASFLSTSARSVSFPVFKARYGEVIKLLQQGKEIPEISLPSPEASKLPVLRNLEVAEKFLSQCYGLLTGGNKNIKAEVGCENQKIGTKQAIREEI